MLHCPKTSRDTLLVAPSPPFTFSHPHISLPVRPLQYSSILPCSFPLSFPLLPNSGCSQSEARKAALSSLDFSAAVSPLCCTVLFLSLWCHILWEENPVFKTHDWYLVTSGHWEVLAHLKWGWINCCVRSSPFSFLGLSVKLPYLCGLAGQMKNVFYVES